MPPQRLKALITILSDTHSTYYLLQNISIRGGCKDTILS